MSDELKLAGEKGDGGAANPALCPFLSTTLVPMVQAPGSGLALPGPNPTGQKAVPGQPIIVSVACVGDKCAVWNAERNECGLVRGCQMATRLFEQVRDITLVAVDEKRLRFRIETEDAE